jgi:hypothetical protein
MKQAITLFFLCSALLMVALATGQRVTVDRIDIVDFGD